MKYIPAKTIISAYTASKPWFGTNYNMNIYRGCSHGCIYCDSRSNCYHIENFDEVCVKENALQIIRDELRRKTKKGVIGTGAMSDPYNPFEKDLELTRNALQFINVYQFGAAIATKSNLIARDIDVLCDIKKHSPVLVKMTVTTFDDKLCKKIEPHVCVSSKRFEAIKKLADKDIFAGVLLMPILPFINDTEENILNIVRQAHACGAKFVLAYGMGVTLRQNQREYFYNQLDTLFPGQHLKENYIETFGSSYECSSNQSRRLSYLFKAECSKLGLLYKMQDIISAYKSGYEERQLSLFE
jgi:DNA repair photolyase